MEMLAASRLSKSSCCLSKARQINLQRFYTSVWNASCAYPRHNCWTFRAAFACVPLIAWLLLGHSR